MTRLGPFGVALYFVVGSCILALVGTCCISSPALMAVVSFASMIAFSAFVLWLNFQYERRIWNRGTCRQCGEPFFQFGKSIFASGYMCANKHVIWIENKAPERSTGESH